MEKHAQGKAAGGIARASKMSQEERSASARKAAAAKSEAAKLPSVTHKGEISIGGITIPCIVISNGMRLITESGMSDSILGGRSGASKRIKKKAAEGDGAPFPVFLAPSQLKPFISKDLEEGPLLGVRYSDDGRAMLGFEASLLPQVCEVWLKARQAGALQDQQQAKAQKAEVLMRGLAHVGIIALVDEATGFQKDRAKDALAKILESFVAKELRPWVSTFPADYYEQLFRLYGYPFPPEGNPQWRPQFFGKITNEVVYNRLAPDLLPELKKAASKAERKAKLHQWLTNDIGHPRLREHLSSIVTLLKLSRSPEEFRDMVDRIHPRFGGTMQLDFNEH